jgi:hypothetical protein
MKKIFQLLTIALLTTLGATAQNMHYVDGPTTTDNGTTLTVSGRIAGLGNNKGILIKVSTTATISTECTNPAGNIAPGQSRTETITREKTFYSDKNGNVYFELTTFEQKPGMCPNGKWTGRVTDISFVNTTVTVDGKMIN